MTASPPPIRTSRCRDRARPDLARPDSLGGTRVTLTQTRAGSLIASIHPWRTGFVLGWNEYEGTSDHDPGGRSQVLLRMIP